MFCAIHTSDIFMSLMSLYIPSPPLSNDLKCESSASHYGRLLILSILLFFLCYSLLNSSISKKKWFSIANVDIPTKLTRVCPPYFPPLCVLIAILIGLIPVCISWKVNDIAKYASSINMAGRWNFPRSMNDGMLTKMALNLWR